MAKRIGLKRTRQLELLIEAFNLTNRVNFRSPRGIPAESGARRWLPPAFLMRTAARDARQIQWGVRYMV